MKPTTRKPALALAVLLALVIGAPGFVLAFTLIGGSLGIGTTGNGYQRDFHVWNNSADVASNNNTTADPAYPGALGAVLSMWKASKAWASENPLASKNFDYDYQGTTTSSLANQNTISWGSSGCGGGTLAYTETPISDGWRILFCDSFNWEDGPGSPGTGTNDFDIQGVGAHEIGHALGMGHSQSANCGGACSGRPSMCAAICFDGESERTINPDDAAGLEAIYGIKPANKPTITSLGGSTSNGATLIINGTNFASTVHVKFTAANFGNLLPMTGVVQNVLSSAGGTQISVTVPAAATDGNVIVWEPSLNLMSNAFPIDINFVPPTPPSIVSFSPPNVNAFQGGTVTVTGSGFLGATQIAVGGQNLFAPAGFTVVNNTSITFNAPNAVALGPVNVTVTTPVATSAPMPFTYVETFPARIGNGPVTISNTPYTWTWGAGLNDSATLVVSAESTTSTFGTPYNILVNTLEVGVAPCNATVGTGSMMIIIPPGYAGLTFYSQVIAVDDLTPNWSASNITSTFILF